MIMQNGLILRERLVGEHDKFLDIITQDLGIIEISAKGAGKINAKSRSSAQVFSYAKLCLNEKKSRYYLNSAEPIHIFYGIRDSFEKITLASYFSEVLCYCITTENQNEEIMRLVLNCLHYLEKGSREPKLLKAVFELRLMSDIGYMPDVIGCQRCGRYDPEFLYFSEKNCYFHCEECYSPIPGYHKKVPLAVLSAIRHIVLADFNRVFNFKLSESSMDALSEISENYITYHLDRNFRTLDYYKDL